MNKDIKWVVAKFGGTSVTSIEAIKNIALITKQYKEKNKKIVLVVSALSNVSNQLHLLAEGKETKHIGIRHLYEYHKQWAEDANIWNNRVQSMIEDVLEQLSNAVDNLNAAQDYQQKVQYQASVLSHGELLSSQLLKVYLQEQLKETVSWFDARLWLTSQDFDDQSQGDRFLNAQCQLTYDSKKESELAKLGDILITQGFIANNMNQQTVLLGRGGSDTSASYFSVLLGAEQLDIWTDVPGMFSANPRELPEARQLLKLDFSEAQEIASSGAKVLHPRSIRPVRDANIPVFIGSTLAPEKGGSLIGFFQQSEPQVKAISVRHNVIIIALETVDMWQKPGFLAEAFDIFRSHGLSVDQVSTSETNVTVTLDNLQQGITSEQLEKLVLELQKISRVKVIENCSSVSIVGRSIRSMLFQMGHIFDAFQNRSIHLLTQAANDLNFTFVVDEEEASFFVKHLHQLLIQNADKHEEIGQSWALLMNAQSQPKTQLVSDAWWKAHQKDLNDLGTQKGPCYVYSLDKVSEQLNSLQQLQSVDKIFYALKANHHDAILEVVEHSGFGFECVSWNEVRYVLQKFPDIDPQRILFTPNFAPKVEYQLALDAGVHLTIDNLYVLDEWGELFKNAQVLLRIDTGQGKGHHEHVKTAGSEAKFGIPMNMLQDYQERIQELSIQVVGLHCHVGSGILSPDNWAHNGQHLKSLLTLFPDVKYLDLGGGLGIVEKPNQNALPLAQVDDSLAKFRQTLKHDIELWLEPGRFIVAEAGVLLARVTQLKGKSGARYLGIDTGMNSLIRPALYDAYHPIVNLTRIDEPAIDKMTVVGPICETGDKLGVERWLPTSQENDVILIANCGAYGRVMSSHYNMREPADEVILLQDT